MQSELKRHQADRRFTVPSEWTLAYTYNCAAFGGSGNFVVDGYNSDGHWTSVVRASMSSEPRDVPARPFTLTRERSTSASTVNAAGQSPYCPSRQRTIRPGKPLSRQLSVRRAPWSVS